MKYKVKVRFGEIGTEWRESGNRGLRGVTFDTRQEAEKAKILYGTGGEYRVFPEALDEAEVLDKIKAIIDTPTPPTKLEQIKAILEGL
jgi:hypothetical protein